MTRLTYPKGWLLAYSLFFFAVAVGIAIEAYKDYSTILLLQASGFAILSCMMFTRSRWTLFANAVFAFCQIAIGVFIYVRMGEAWQLIAGILAICCYFPIRDELKERD